MDGISWIGVSGRKLDSLAPHEVRDIVLSVVPYKLGLKTISGIKLLDTFLKRTYSFDDLGQVFVSVNNYSNKGKIV